MPTSDERLSHPGKICSVTQNTLTDRRQRCSWDKFTPMHSLHTCNKHSMLSVTRLPHSPFRCIISNDKERFSLRIPVFLNDSLKVLTLYVTDASACIVHRNECTFDRIFYG